MEAGEFNWRSGFVEYWSLDNINADKPIRDHDRWDLKEDLALVRFPGNVFLDVGWYPQGSIDGRFVVQVILNEDWQQAVKKWECTTVRQLVAALAEAISSADLVSSDRTSNEGR